jgi:hypothetical protein
MHRRQLGVVLGGAAVDHPLGCIAASIRIGAPGEFALPGKNQMLSLGSATKSAAAIAWRALLRPRRRKRIDQCLRSLAAAFAARSASVQMLNARSLGRCKDCQKFSSSAFAVVVGVPEAAFSVQGKRATYGKTGDTGKSAERQFCPSEMPRHVAPEEPEALIVSIVEGGGIE